MKTRSDTVLAYLRSLAHRHADAASDDRELLRRIGERRDEDAFAVLMQRHGAMVLNSARRITGDEQLAEDVFQATFLMLSRKANTIRRAEALPCWLHGVARRLAVQARRAHVRRREQEARVLMPASADPLEELSARELVAVLDEEIGRLPQDQRAPLILCCLEGLSQEEAAKRLGCSPGAVKGRLERGRQRLRMRLEQRGLTLPAVLGGTLLLAGATSPVPAALTQAALQAATRGVNVSPAVAALIQETMRMLVVAKFKVFVAVVIALALAGVGVGMMSLGPQAAKENAEPPAAANDNPMSANRRVDLYGDPLPDGAVMRLGTLQRRAVGMELAVTADGKSIIGARGPLSLCCNWDAVSGELRSKRELPDPWGVSVLSPDGRWLAPGPGEPLVIWDVRTVEKYRVLGTKGNGSFWPIAFSSDSKRVAAIASRQDKKGSCEHLICAWELADGKEIFRTELRNDRRLGRLAFSPDGKHLLASFLSSTSDTGLYCWDIAAGRQAWLNEQITCPESMVFPADGKILTSPWGETVDLSTGRTIKLENPLPLKGKDGGFEWNRRLTMTPDGRTLLIPKSNGVIVWDMVHGKQLRVLQGAGEEVLAMPDGKSIISNDGSLQRWDLETGKPMWPDTFALGHIGGVTEVAFSADGKRLASVSADGSVRLWDAATGRPLRVWRPYKRRHPLYRDAKVLDSLDITPDGRWILTGSDERLTLCDASTEKVARSLALPGHDSLVFRLQVFQLRIRADGSRAVGLFGAVADPPTRNKLATWDLKTGQMLTCPTFEQSIELFSALSPDGWLLLRKGDFVDTASGQKIARLEGPPSYPCAFSRDGALVVGAGNQTTDGLRVWESATGKTVAHLESEMYIYQVAFHPNNRLVAISNRDGIQLYDSVTGKLLATRRMPKGMRNSNIVFALAPDGRRLATGLPDGTILMWDISLPSPKPQRLSAKEIESLWADLADADAAKAWRVVWRMADAPNDALVFLRSRVKPYPTAAADVMRKLLADLDSESFEVREAALKRLKELGPQAEPALRAAIQAKPSLEQRRRIEELLAAAPLPPTSEELRQLRALIVLECIGTPEARRLLEAAAKGPPSARLTRQAQAALSCLP